MVDSYGEPMKRTKQMADSGLGRKELERMASGRKRVYVDLGKKGFVIDDAASLIFLALVAFFLYALFGSGVKAGTVYCPSCKQEIMHAD